MSTPKANNSLNSLGVFKQRTLYKDKIYPNSLPSSIDIWYQKPLYGKINAFDRSIFLSEASLKQLKTKEKKILMAVNFVVDAFSDMKTFYERSIKQGKLSVNEGELSELEPKIAWENIHTLYQSHISSMFNVFRDTFTKEFNRDEKIVDFNSFLKIFLEYIDLLNPTYPFTRTSFIITKFCPVETTGLTIKLKDYNHAIDKAKYEKFILDKNYEFFTRAAQQHGFMVDKNAPWRIIADVASPAMVPYMKKYGITKKNIFGNFYYETFKTELDVLKIYVSQFYNSYVLSKPFIEIIKHHSVTKNIATEIIERKTIKPEQLSDEFWMKLLVYIRCRETNTELSQTNFDRFVQNTNDVLKNIDKITALEYIERHLNNALMLSIDEKNGQSLPERIARHTDFSF